MNGYMALQSQPALSDMEVVARVQRGEKALYGVLVDRHNRQLYRILRRILPSHELVEDIMQEAHLRAFQRIGQFDGRASFATWLSKVMLNEAYTYLRRKREFQLISAIPIDDVQIVFAQRGRNPEQHTLQRELREILELAIACLPEQYRMVFTARKVEHLSTRDTAACLGITEQCVKTRLLRARQLLQKYMRGGIRLSDDPAKAGSN